MTCLRCQKVRTVPRIAVPRDLTRAIRNAREALRASVLEETDYWPEGEARFTFDAFSEVPEKGGWDDILVYYFRCSSCGQLYRLSAETYHGSGGSFVKYIERE